MNLIFQYSDYLDHLKDPNPLVRLWAFDALDTQYYRRYAPEVAQLLSQPDDESVSAAAHYLARHQALDQAPAILECFNNHKGKIGWSCGSALGKLGYLPAKESILARLADIDSEDTLLGISEYCAKVQDDECHQALRELVKSTSSEFYAGRVARNLLCYADLKDIPLVLKNVPDERYQDIYISDLMESIGARGIYGDLVEYNLDQLMTSPDQAISYVLDQHQSLKLPKEFRDQIVKLLLEKKYSELASLLAVTGKEKISGRYPQAVPDHLGSIYQMDVLSLAMLTEFDGRVTSSQPIRDDLTAPGIIAAMLASCFSIIQRSGLQVALSLEATVDDLMHCLESSGDDLPQPVFERLLKLAPAERLRDSLSKDYSAWADITIVRIMAETDSSEFIPDLIQVFNATHFLDIIHDKSLSALHRVQPPDSEIVLASVKKNIVEDPSSQMALLRCLPYAESFDIAKRLWDEDEIGDYEEYASCLAGIGDPRGVKALQEIFFEENAVYVGDSLETLALLHHVDIPELPMIREKRQEELERSKARRSDLDAMAMEYGGYDDSIDQFDFAAPVRTFKRDTPKIGRNQPCPCGSGKKYKKCCLNK